MRLIPIALLLLLAACSRGDEGRTAGGVTQAEADALDDAAEMLDSQRLPADALPAPQAPLPAAPNAPGKPSAKPAG